MKPTVALILPRGEAIRNFIYSGMAASLTAQAEVIAISVVPNETIRMDIEEVVDDFLQLPEVANAKPVDYVRDFLDMVHGRWLWSEAAKERWELRDHEAKTLSQKIKRKIKKAFALSLAHRGCVQALAEVEKIVSEKIFPNKYLVSLLKNLKPDLVFNGSHSHSRNATSLIYAAKVLDIPTATFLFSWDNLTSQGRIMPLYDHYIVWNKAIQEDLHCIYHSIKPEQVSITGTPQFDFHFQKERYWTRETYCQHIGADPQRPILLYTTGMPNHMPGEDVVIEGIANILLKYSEKDRPQLLVRIYPKDKTDRFEKLKLKRKDILFPTIPWEPNFLTPLPEDITLWTNMLLHCDLGINVASTTTLEFCMFDKPAICVGYNPPGLDISPKDYTRYYNFDHYIPIVKSNAIYLPRSVEEMEKIIAKCLTTPAEKSNQRKALVKNFFGNTLDGNANKRIANVLIRIANNEKIHFS